MFDESDGPAATDRAAVSLPDLLERARRTEVRGELATARVAEVVRWVQPESRWRWLPFSAGLAVAAAAAALAIWMWRTPATTPLLGAVQVGDRVAIVSEPGTQYRIAATTRDATEIVVERGAVTARLWPGTQRHQLALRGGDVVATATGTIYTLAVDAAGAHVSVHEGQVDVARAAGHELVVAGNAAATGAAAARRLRALPEPAQPEPLPPITPPVPVAIADAGVPADAAARSASDAAAPAPPPNERWREIRLLRAQNKLAAAVAGCLALADARDPTWSPIALVEAIRIELGPRAAPERAIELADRMLREWPQHTLASEARELRKQAAAQVR